MKRLAVLLCLPFVACCGSSHGHHDKKSTFPPDGVRTDGNVLYVDKRLDGILSYWTLCKDLYRHADYHGDIAEIQVASIRYGVSSNTVICHYEGGG